MKKPADTILEALPDWRGRLQAVDALSGGITNTNYLVTVDGQKYVVRIAGANTEHLGVDREIEARNSRQAARIGIGPQVVRHVPERGVMVLEFIEGRTLTPADLNAPGMPGRLGQAIARLHAGPAFANRFDMLAMAERYQQTIAEMSAPQLADWEQYRPRMEAIVRALAVDPPDRVACHNDLLAGNLIDTGSELRIIDYEYSGSNDPCFELGNTCQEQEYSDEQIAELFRAYFAADRPQLVARTCLNMIVSDFGWALWAMIQSKISQLDFDFLKYGQNRWQRAQAKLDGEQLPKWIDGLK